MDEERIATLVDDLSGTGSDREWAAVHELRTLGTELPKFLLKKFRSATSWKVRNLCVYHSMRYAKISPEAVEVGLLAISDKSKEVRYRGAMLLAYSQRRDVMSALQDAVGALSGKSGAEDLIAAFDAIDNGNHHLFVDRKRTGKFKLTIE